jgi:membrane-bound lytic murein transglycosylase MltF
MQLLPPTQEEVAEKLGIDEASEPNHNIHLGIYHFYKLFSTIDANTTNDRLQIALAAYNCGIGRISDAQKICNYLGNSPKEWKSIRDALPFLSKRFSSLHSAIWNDEKPSGGYLNNWRETTSYVENVNRYFNEYKMIF